MLFVESIKLLDGELYRLAYHQKRLADTIKKYHPDHEILDLEDVISIEDYRKKGLFKVRIVYGQKIESLVISPYKIKEIKSIKVVDANEISYPSKFLKRENLSYHYEQKGDFDEILFSKHGLLTDAYYYNVALSKNEQWYTPKTPLLHGVMRADLIDQGILIGQDISAKHLDQYDKICLINAMTELGEIVLDIDSICQK